MHIHYLRSFDDYILLGSKKTPEPSMRVKTYFVIAQFHKRAYKAHPFDFDTDIFLSTLQKDPDTELAMAKLQTLKFL